MPWDRLCSLPHLRRAWVAVHRSRGAPGLDRVTVDDFQADAAKNIAQLQTALVTGSWRPLPLRRARLPCLDRDDRTLAISTVRDRLVHRAVADLLQPVFEPWFSDVSHAFRPRRSAFGAIQAVLKWIRGGEVAWILRADIRRFFDSIDRAHLDVLLRARVPDARVLDLVERILRQPLRERRQLVESIEGIPQGSPLSPLLSNVYLDGVDVELSARHPRMIRFCDDILVGAHDEEEVKTALERLDPALDAIGLQLHPKKTAVLSVDDGFEFLGFRVSRQGLGPSRGAVQALSHRLVELRAVSGAVPGDARRVFERWNAYYRTTLDEVAPLLAPELLELLGVERRPPAPAEPVRSVIADPVLEMAEDLARRLLDGFPGREGVFASEGLDDRGQRIFRAVRRGIETEDLRRHLVGEVCLGVYLLRGNDTVRLAVLDVDAKRRKSPHTGRHEVIPEDANRARGYSVRLAKQLNERGVPCLLEDSGAKGGHLWMRFDAPQPAETVVKWLEDLLKACDDPPEHVRVEIFPDRDRVPRDGDGPLVKLPLGIHAGTGRRCVLLDATGAPVSGPSAVLDAWEEILGEVLEQGSKRSGAERPGPLDSNRFPVAAELLRGCTLLAALDHKAAETGYLDHRERLALLGTVGHLDGDGSKALHAIIANCSNYKERVTQRYLDGNAPHPVSCGRLRQNHRELTRSVGCDCRFNVPRGAYPTPLLHVMPPKRVPGFDRRMRDIGRSPEKGTAAGSKASGHSGPTSHHDPAMEVDRLVKQIARHKRNMVGINASIEKAYQGLSDIMDRLRTDRVPVESGMLVRSREGEETIWRVEI